MTEAIQCIRLAVEENPMYAEAYNNLGVLYRDQVFFYPSIHYNINFFSGTLEKGLAVLRALSFLGTLFFERCSK